MFKQGYYEELGYDSFYKLEDFRRKYSSLASTPQISLLIGLISNYKFSNGQKIEKVLEIGIYNGVTSLYMLKTGCANSTNYKQYGIDIDTKDFCGEAVLKEATPEELNCFNLHKGKTALNIPEILNKNEKLDLVFIDGGHCHPLPLIDLVSIIPYLHEESIICLHDVVDYHYPQAWGESFIYEIWPDNKYRNINQAGIPETLGIIKPLKNKDLLHKTLIDLAKIPHRAAPWKFNNKYRGIDENALNKLNQNMLEHYDKRFVEQFIGHLSDNLKTYDNEYILRIHETRFLKYLYEEIQSLHSKINDLKENINELNNKKQQLTTSNNILKILQQNKNKKILFWGESLYLNGFLKNNDISAYNIVGIIDINAKNKDNQTKYKLFHPSTLKDLDADLIIMTVQKGNEEVYFHTQQYLIKNNINIELAPNIFTN